MLEYTDLFLQVNASINVIMVIALKIPQVLITHLQNAKITVVVAVVAAKVAVAAAVTAEEDPDGGCIDCNCYFETEYAWYNIEDGRGDKYTRTNRYCKWADSAGRTMELPRLEL